MTVRNLPLAAVALAALLSLAGACEDSAESGGTAQIPGGPDTLPPPDQVVEDGEHVMTVEGVKKAVLVAEQLYFYNDIHMVVGDTIQVSFFDDGGQFVSMLTATSGIINQRSQEMTAYGNVDVRSEDSRIETEVLHYDPAADRIWSDSPTVINQQGNVIRGRGVESDPGLKEIRIRGGSAILRSEPDVGPTPRPDPAAREPDAAPPDPDRTDEDGAGETGADRAPEVETSPAEPTGNGAEEPDDGGA